MAQSLRRSFANQRIWRSASFAVTRPNGATCDFSPFEVQEWQLGQALVYSAFASTEKCGHELAQMGYKLFEVQRSGVRRQAFGSVDDDPFYESAVLRDALQLTATTNITLARQQFARLEHSRLRGLTSSLQGALQGTNAALLAKLLEALPTEVGARPPPKPGSGK
jgi:hypothetical protein